MVPAVVVLAVRSTVSFDDTGISYRNLVRSGRIPLEDVAGVAVAERWWTHVGDANLSAGWHMSSPVLKVRVRGVRGGRTLTASAPFHLAREGRERVTAWCSEHSIPMA